MKEEVMKKFLENYENKGDCKNLPKFLKSFTKEFKKTNTEKVINYYPWAVIERIFRMQGGKIEVKEWAYKVSFSSQDYVPNEDGELVLEEVENNALFMLLEAEWQGEVLEEYYPLFDNQNAKVIKTPNAMDLNTARQRGSVRLIARLSGIGLDIFEQQDSQFDNEDTPETSGEKTTIKTKEDKDTKEEKKTKSKKTKTKKKTQKEIAKEKQDEAMKEFVEEENEEDIIDAVDEEDEEDNSEGFMKEFIKGSSIEEDVEEEKVEEQKQTQKDFIEEEFDMESQEYADLLLEVRKTIKDGSLQKDAKKFVKKQNKELLSELTYSELKELKDILV